MKQPPISFGFAPSARKQCSPPPKPPRRRGRYFAALLLAAIAAAVTLSTTARAAVYIDDAFDYADGNLGTPWTIANATGNSSAVVGAAATLNGFTPVGKQATLTRPTTSGDGLISATLSTGENDGTGAWNITSGDHVTLTLDFSISSVPSGAAFSLFLRGKSSTALLGVRVISNGSTGSVQTMTTGSTSSFTDVADSPALAFNTWYRLTVDLDVTSSTTTAFSLALEQLGADGGPVYDGSGFGLTVSTSFLGTGSFQMGASSGVPSFSVADVALVPEPTVARNLAAAILLGFLVCRYRPRHA